MWEAGRAGSGPAHVGDSPTSARHHDTGVEMERNASSIRRGQTVLVLIGLMETVLAPHRWAKPLTE